MEAAGAMDERNGPLDHSALEKRSAFSTATTARTLRRISDKTINPSRPLLSDTYSWSRKWGPPHTGSLRFRHLLQVLLLPAGVVPSQNLPAPLH